MKISKIVLPQLGVNDITAKIIEWHKKEGDYVKKGEIVCTVETTKSIFEVEVQDNGYIYFLYEVGDEVSSGSVIGLISDEKENKDKIVREYEKNHKQLISELNEEKIQITEKAKLLAKRLNIDISHVKPINNKITEDVVLKYSDSLKKGEIKRDFMDTMDDLFPNNKVERLIIIGAGDGAIQVIDALNKIPNQKAVMLFDDNKGLQDKLVAGVPIVGGIDYEHIIKLFNSKKFDKAIISISTSIAFRAKVYEDLTNRGIPFANVIHPSTVIGSNVAIGSGNIILANCHIGACTQIGNNNFISAFCSIEHHNILLNHCSFGPAVVTSSKVIIDDRVRFGTGIFIEPHIKIGNDSIISSGAILTKDIPPKMIVKTHINYSLRTL